MAALASIQACFVQESPLVPTTSMKTWLNTLNKQFNKHKKVKSAYPHSQFKMNNDDYKKCVLKQFLKRNVTNFEGAFG